MDHKHHVVGKGLKTMFIGEIVTLVFTFLVWVPLLGPIGILAGGVLVIMGLYTASTAHLNYKYCMYIRVVGIVLGILLAFASTGILSGSASAFSVVLTFAEVYLVCTTTAKFLRDRGDENQAKRGETIWKLYAVCAIVIAVCDVLMAVPVLNILAGLVAVISGIVSLVAGVLYLMFLYHASSSLLAA